MAINYNKFFNSKNTIDLYFTNNFKPLDMQYEKTLYGKVDTEHYPIIPKLSSISVVKGESALRSANLGYAVNIMAEAFGDFSKEIERSYIINRYSKNDSLYSSITPKKSYENLFDVIEPKIIEFLNTQFLENYMSIENRTSTTLNLKDFINNFLMFVSTSRTPLLPSSFHLSTRVLHTNGIVIDIAQKDLNNIEEKQKWLSDKNFNYITNTAKKYSLFVDKNYPWRFIFNFESPEAVRYYNKFGVNSKKEYFNLYYDRLTFQDIYFLQTYMSRLFANFCFRSPIVRESVVCNNVVTYKNTNRDLLEPQAYVNQLKFNEWLKLYIYLKFKENCISITQSKFDSILKEVDLIFASVDYNTTIRYVEDLLNKYMGVGANPKLNNPSINFSEVYNYNIKFKV